MSLCSYHCVDRGLLAIRIGWKWLAFGCIGGSLSRNNNFTSLNLLNVLRSHQAGPAHQHSHCSLGRWQSVFQCRLLTTTLAQDDHVRQAADAAASASHTACTDDESYPLAHTVATWTNSLHNISRDRRAISRVP